MIKQRPAGPNTQILRKELDENSVVTFEMQITILRMIRDEVKQTRKISGFVNTPFNDGEMDDERVRVVARYLFNRPTNFPGMRNNFFFRQMEKMMLSMMIFSLENSIAKREGKQHPLFVKLTMLLEVMFGTMMWALNAAILLLGAYGLWIVSGWLAQIIESLI